ncbi:unnamed protein product [Polarella glacialis]|uniref:Uncharacterized protein n=1 Tax=Polarella glacialis TaxID=89957 RepID=A0A813L327_POLGL|nr:unnamed protein product [Polarella glacialis]
MAVMPSAEELLGELAALAVADIIGGGSAEPQMLGSLSSSVCDSSAERWALGLVFAGVQVGQVVDTLSCIVDPEQATTLLWQWAGIFEAELPPADEEEDEHGGGSEVYEVSARAALRQAVVETAGEECESKALDLARDGLIRLPTWSPADLKVMAGGELREKLAKWFMGGLTERLVRCFRSCRLLAQLRSVGTEEGEAMSLPAAVAAAAAASSALRGCVSAAVQLAEEAETLRELMPTIEGEITLPCDISRATKPAKNAQEEPQAFRAAWSGEPFLSLIASALDSAFRRTEAETPSLLIRPLWRLASARLIWQHWSTCNLQAAGPSPGLSDDFTSRTLSPLLRQSQQPPSEAGGTEWIMSALPINSRT